MDNTNYKYSNRKKRLEAYKKKVLCLLQAHDIEKMSFAEAAKACKIDSGRIVAFRIYDANKSDHELKNLSKM